MNNELQTANETNAIAPPQSLSPTELLSVALEKGIDADSLEKLMDLQERHEANNARKAFYNAMAEFQALCPTIIKSKESTSGNKYTYAPLDTVIKTIRPHLDATGLSVRFDSELTGGEVVTATCYVSHRDGHEIASKFAAPIDIAQGFEGSDYE